MAKNNLNPLEVKAFRHSGGNSRIEALNDGEGLDLIVSPSNRRTWRLRYTFGGKRPEISLGKYPEISLAAARESAAKIKALAAGGIDPKQRKRERAAKTFSIVSMEWWESQKHTWKPEHAKRVKYWLTTHAFPVIGNLSMDTIDAGHITDIMHRVNGSSCAPLLAVIRRVFGRALTHRLTKHNPAQDFPLRDVVPPLPETKHRAAITDYKLLGQLMRDIHTDETGSKLTTEALKLLPYIFVRPKELYTLKWESVDFEKKQIRISGEDMKKGRAYVVPLAKQVLHILEELHKLTGYSRCVFPNIKDASRPMSKNVMNDKLRRMGYGADVCCSHGFRGTASTMLREMQYSHDVVELSLAHLVGSATSRAYNSFQLMPERTKLMQKWADYLDGLRDGAQVIPMHKKTA